MFPTNQPVTNEYCPLASKGWRTFNERLWNLTSDEISYKPRGENGPTLNVVTYKDSSGRYVLPSMNPHWHMRFTHTNTKSSSRIYRQWDEAASLMVDDMLATGTHGRIALPPEINDIRQWQWSGFRSHALYTVLVNFPYSTDQAEPATRRNLKRSVKSGFKVEFARNLEDVITCLHGTESRKKFDHSLTAERLKMGLDLMGPDQLRLYVNYAPNGEPAAARMVIAQEGEITYDIAAGTQNKYLKSGATQQLIGHILMDAQNTGASGFNFSCANIESVSPAKLCWGGQLVNLHGIEGFDYLPVRRTVGSFVRLWKNQSKQRHRKQDLHDPKTSNQT